MPAPKGSPKSGIKKPSKGSPKTGIKKPPVPVKPFNRVKK